MTDQPERIVDEPTTERESGRDALTTADMAAATATVPARNKIGTDRSERSDATSTENEVGEVGPLFHRDEADEFQSRWFAIQACFVDEPRQSVEEADQLVAAVMKRLAEVFSTERQNLEKDWDTGEDVSTEDLRVAFTRYRSFFDRLLSV
jgi:hypothetical protein